MSENKKGRAANATPHNICFNSLNYNSLDEAHPNAPVISEDNFGDVDSYLPTGMQDGDRSTRTGPDLSLPTWPEALPLVAKVEPEPYPIDALPPLIRAAVEEVAGFVKAPIAMVASSALASLSLASQAHIDVRRAEKLEGPTGLFLLTIADSGERKSTCDGFFSSAVRKYQEDQYEAAKPELKNYSAALDAWEAKRAGIKDKIRLEAKAGKSTSLHESELCDLEHQRPEPPKIPRLIYADVTPEALAYSLARQWPSAGVISSEAGVVFGSHGMGKDSAMRNFALINQLWDGASLSIDRRTSESFVVKGARLTMALQVQEPTIREFFQRTGELARGTGFLARFLISWPESTQGTRAFTEAPQSWPHLAAFQSRLSEILHQPATIDDDGCLTPSKMVLEPSAKAAWVAYHDGIEADLITGGDLYDVRDVASKSADNAVRLAALFQRCSENGGVIGHDAFERASCIAAWHLYEARRFFGELALPSELADALRLENWLIKICQREHRTIIGKTHALQSGPLRRKDRLEAALKELKSRYRVRERSDDRQKTIEIHPELLGVVS